MTSACDKAVAAPCPKGGWQEYFSKKEQRCYYIHKETGENGWEPPLLFVFQDCQLEAQV